jgi:hypothetical protein
LGPSFIKQFSTPGELDKYAAIQSTSFRAKPKRFSSFIQRWLETKQKYIDIQNYLKDDFSQPGTSVFKVMEGMIGWMIRTAEEDADMVLHDLVIACTKAYKYWKEPKFNLILNQFQTILSLGNAILGTLYGSPLNSVSKETGDFLTLKLSAIAQEIKALELMIWPSRSDNPKDNFAEQLFNGVGRGYQAAHLLATSEARSTCYNTAFLSMQTLICLRHHLNGLVLWKEANHTYTIRHTRNPGNFSRVEERLLGNFSDDCSYGLQQSSEFTSEFPSLEDESYLALGHLVGLQQLVTKLQSCMSEYAEFLDRVSNIQLTVPPYEVVSFNDLSDYLPLIDESISYFDSIMQQFLDDRISHLHAANKFSNLTININKLINEIFTKLVQRVMQRLENGIQEITTILSQFYFDDILTNAVFLAEYVPHQEKQIRSLVKKIVLFKSPRPLVKKNITRMTSPRPDVLRALIDAGLKEFHGAWYIDHRLDWYFNPLLDALADAIKGFAEKQFIMQQLEQDATAIQQELSEQTKIGDDYIKWAQFLQP